MKDSMIDRMNEEITTYDIYRNSEYVGNIAIDSNRVITEEQYDDFINKCLAMNNQKL